MSVEFQIGFPCPHLTIEEVVRLGSDRRSLETRQPIGSSSLVRILANDQIYIPPAGIHSQAILKGAVSGPYRILPNENTLTVTSSIETRTFTLPVGTRVQGDHIVKVFKAQFENIIVENEGGFLVFLDVANIGRKSRIQVSGTAASALGFGEHSGTRGREVYPSWQLVKRVDPFGPSLSPLSRQLSNRFPQFTRPVRGNPTFKLTYTVPVERCLRCGATYVENDARFNRQGDPLIIENENLLYQAALKILLTRKGSNPFHTWYGTSLLSRIGSKATGVVATLINEDVRLALENMQAEQKAQSKYQKVSIRERLYSIQSVNTSQHENDPTAFLVDVVVSNGSGEPISLSIVFTVPGAIALAGSNNLSLGLDTTGLTAEESRLLLR